MLHLVTAGKRGGKTTFIYNEIKSRSEKNLESVLIVPEQFSLESERQIIKKLGHRLSVNVEVIGLSRLAEKLVSPSHLPTLEDSGRYALMYLAVDSCRDKLKAFAGKKGVRGRMSILVSEMLGMVTEFRQCSISPDMLFDAASAQKNDVLKRKLSDLAMIYSAYELLTENKFSDSSHILDRLSEELDNNRYFEGKTVCFDGFSGYTAQEYNVISKIMSQSNDCFFTLCVDSGHSPESDFSRFAFTRKTARELFSLADKCGVEKKIVVPEKYDGNYSSDALKHLEQYFFALEHETFSEETGDITVYRASDTADECRFVALTARKLLQDEKYRCRDIAVIAREDTYYSKSLRSAMIKHGLPVFEDRRVSLLTQPLTVYIRTVLEILSAGFTTERMFRLLKTGLVGFDAQEIAETEEYVYTWQIDYGKWLKEWTDNPYGLDRSSDDAQELLLRFNSLRRALTEPVLELKKKFEECISGEEMVKALYEHLVLCSVPEKLKNLAVTMDKNGDTSAAADTGRVWDYMMQTLEQFSLALADTKITPEELTDLFVLVMTKRDMGVIPSGIDEIIIGSADRVRLNDPKAVFIVGASDGSFPLRPGQGKIFTDRERAELIREHLRVNEPSSNAFLRERFLMYNSACSASEKLFVCYPHADSSGKAAEASEFVSEVISLFPHCKMLNSGTLPDYYSYLGNARAFESYCSSFRSDSIRKRTLERYFETGSGDPDSEDYAARIDSVKRAGEHRKQNMRISPESAEKLYGKRLYMSSTSADAYSQCPFNYFCRYGLRLKERRKAEIDKRLSGTIIHFVLENIVKVHGKGLGDMDEKTIKEEIAKLFDEYWNNYLADSGTLNEKIKYKYEEIYKSVFLVVRRLQYELKNSLFEPVDTELPIGGKDGIKAVEIDLHDGGKVIFTGIVDRVDILKTDRGNFIRVMDYKSGRKIFSLADCLHGLNMQMLLYLFAVCENGKARYGSVMPAGVFYISAKTGGTHERVLSESELDSQIYDDGRMSGLLLDDEEIIKDCDINIHSIKDAKNSKILPKTLSKILIDAETLGRLGRVMDEKLAEIGEGILSGNVGAYPTYKSGDDPHCKYCLYSDICRFEPGDHENQYPNMDLKTSVKALNGEEDAK